jgi:hypothetical protein
MLPRSCGITLDCERDVVEPAANLGHCLPVGAKRKVRCNRAGKRCRAWIAEKVQRRFCTAVGQSRCTCVRYDRSLVSCLALSLTSTF